jgi:hypothetical protein
MVQSDHYEGLYTCHLGVAQLAQVVYTREPPEPPEPRLIKAGGS